MEEIKENLVESKTKKFLKKYGYYLIMGGVLLAVALIVGITSVVATSSSSNNTDVEVNTGAIEFVSPVANATILKGYSATELQFNKQLNEWSIHKGIDFAATKGANVMACYDGEIESVSSNVVDGTVITINHGNNLKTVYKLLNEDVKVKVGDKISTGDVIGTVSSAASTDSTDSSQIHFEVWKDGSKVDPSGYLNIESK